MYVCEKGEARKEDKGEIGKGMKKNGKKSGSGE